MQLGAAERTRPFDLLINQSVRIICLMISRCLRSMAHRIFVVVYCCSNQALVLREHGRFLCPVRDCYQCF